MLSGDYNYNETVKKVITVFGTMFNNILIARRDGDTVTNVQKVPISYGPQKKFLSRIKADALNKGQKIGIKLPRISFDLLAMNYAADKQLNKLNRNYVGDCSTGEGLTSRWEEVNYLLTISLNVYGNSLDDVLQIVEQILPLFSPSYTVSIKELVGEGTVSEVPFTLQGVNMEDSYEGDYSSRRAIIYTLDFECRVPFAGPQKDIGLIETIDVNFYDKLIGEIDEDPDASPPVVLEPISNIHIEG